MTRYLIAAASARLADEMVGVAVVLLVLARTGRPALAGAVVTGYMLPAVLSGPVFGAWLDRTAHRRLALAANEAVLAAAAIGLVLTVGRSPAVVPVLLAAAAGVTLPMTSAGFTSMVPRLVPAERLGRATTMDALTFNGAAIAGPALAGTLAAAAGPAAATTAIALIALAGVGAALAVPVPPAGRPRGAGESLLRTTASGIRHLVGVPRLRGATLTTVLGYGSVGVLAVALPLYAAGLGTGRDAAGLLWAALEVGSIAGTLAVARLAIAPHRRVFAGTAAFGVVVAAWPLAGSFGVALALVALAGLPQGPVLPAIFAVRQRYAPPELLAQVATTGASLKIGAYALGAAAGGALATALHPGAMIELVAVAQLAAAGLGWSLARERPPGGAGAPGEAPAGAPGDVPGDASGEASGEAEHGRQPITVSR